MSFTVCATSAAPMIPAPMGSAPKESKVDVEGQDPSRVVIPINRTVREGPAGIVIDKVPPVLADTSDEVNARSEQEAEAAIPKPETSRA